MQLPEFHITGKWITSRREDKNEVNIHEPYAFLVEKERLADGTVADVATIFLTNKECPFTCLMCDLWKNTTDVPVPPGSIPRQIEFALERLPTVRHIKLYNSGNFFDPKAIPVEDYDAIAAILSDFQTVLVENHPKLLGDRVLDFKKMLRGELQVAIGLETVHPEILPLLNKQMTVGDFRSAVRFLNRNDILSRTFILLRPPFMDEKEGVQWAKKSIEFAFDCGVECSVVIPTRTGNGALDHLEKSGYFHQPDISSLEEVLDYGIGLQKGRVFADLWDLERFASCDKCLVQRRSRMHKMNLQQLLIPKIICDCQKD